MKGNVYVGVVFLLVVSCFTPQAAGAGTSYTYRDLGDLGGGSSQALGINDLGMVVGKTTAGANDPHAFLWTRQQGLTSLGGSSVARGVNLAGQAVGEAYMGGSYHAWLWNQPGPSRDLGTLGGTDSLAMAVNDLGHVVGYAGLAPRPTPPYITYHAFLWTEAGGIRSLETLGGFDSFALDINNQDQVVGRAFTSTGCYHAFVWDEVQGLQDLNLPGVNSAARAINNLGQVVGNYFYDPGNPLYYANVFLWSAEAGFQDLGNLGGAYAQANAINNAGQVVGHAAFIPGKGQRAFLWTEADGMWDLNDLVESCPAIITDVFAINEAGEIVGVTAQSRACLLSPVQINTPVPETVWLLGGPLLGMGFWQGRRFRRRGRTKKLG